MTTVDICSPNMTTTTIFFSPDPSISVNLENGDKASNVLTKSSLMLILSPVSLVLGWSPYLSWSLYQEIILGEEELQLQFCLPLLLLMTANPVIQGKLGGIKEMLMAGKRGSKPESLQGSPLHAVSPDNKPATLKTAKSCKTNTSCKFVVTLPTPSFHEEDILQTDEIFLGNFITSGSVERANAKDEKFQNSF